MTRGTGSMESLSHGGLALEPIETASVDELRALQLSRLKWSLRHAYENVEHYRAKFDKVGVHPQYLLSRANLRHDTFTASADPQYTYSFGMFAVQREWSVGIHASS